MNLQHIANVLHLPSAPDLPITGVCIDSRQVKPGELYIAIAGAHFDGHDFISEAVVKGAVAVIANREVPSISVPQLRVPDTLQALATLATAHRQALSCDIIALTGSNGKTSVKEMIAAILPKPSLATLGNLNNHIGVPLSVLRLQKEHRYAVFELGANHVGEIAFTVDIVKPKVALINNIGPAHIAEFGSIEDVARAKGEIYQGVVDGGTVVVNDDDAYAHFWDAAIAAKHVIRFSAHHPATIQAKAVRLTSEGCPEFTLVTPEAEALVSLQVVGPHHVHNALAAAACTYALGLPLADIVAGLNRFTGVKGRMTFLPGKNNTVIIDDTYNANLKSSLAALEALAKRPGPRIFVFGDMGELGSWSAQHHEEVGLAARKYGIEKLLTCGTHSAFTSQAFGADAQHYDSQDALIHALLEQLVPETTILVKGSRASAMEKVVHQLIEPSTAFH